MRRGSIRRMSTGFISVKVQPMENLSSREVARLWAENFSKRRNDREATNLLEKLVLLVLERAHEGEVYYTLRALGIPKIEFDVFRSEQKAA